MGKNHSTDGHHAPAFAGNEPPGTAPEAVARLRSEERSSMVAKAREMVAVQPVPLPEPAREMDEVDSIPQAWEHHGLPYVPALPRESSAWALFGSRGRMQPVPGCITRQPGKVWGPVPDIAMEWVDLKGLCVRGVSVRGHLHRHEGSVRQDQLAVGEQADLLVCAVADGVGAASDSHLGSAVASRKVVSLQEIKALHAGQPTHFDCKDISETLQKAAATWGLEPKRLSTTLTFAVVKRTPVRGADGCPCWRAAVAQIGDSHAYLLRSGSRTWTRVTVSDDEGSSGLPSNVVEPLPKHSLARVWHLDVQSGDVLALTTDGAGNLLDDEPAFGRALAYHCEVHAPSLPVLLYVLDAAVKSYDDDRTFLAIRFGETP